MHSHGNGCSVRSLLHGLALALVAVGASLLAAAAPAQAGTAYQPTALGGFSGTPTVNTSVNGVNAAGQVVGMSPASGTYHAFLWQNGQMQDLGTLPGDTNSNARGINSSGVVVGQSATSSSYRAFVWTSAGGMQDLGATIGPTNSAAFGVNDCGEIVGGYVVGAYFHGFLISNGVLTDLGTLPGGEESFATAINSHGDIAGYADTAYGVYHAVLWRNGVIQDLGSLGGNTYARGINDAGEVVGESIVVPGTAQYHAFLWTSAGGMQDLTPGAKSARARGINDAGQVVGFAQYVTMGPFVAFVWEKGAFTTLPPLPGVTSGEWATAIGANGLVAGTSGTYGVLWTPVPALDATVATDRASYVSGQTAAITVTVTDPNGAGAAGAAVSVTVTAANGRVTSSSGTTGASGQAAFAYLVSARRGGRGTYTVSVSASQAGLAPGSAQTTFQVTR